MASKAYNRGAAFERRVKKYLEEQGNYVVRSAGSRGLVDLMSVNEHGDVWLIQCKTDGIMNDEDRQNLVALAGWCKSKPYLVQRERRGLKWTLLR